MVLIGLLIINLQVYNSAKIVCNPIEEYELIINSTLGKVRNCLRI